MAWSFCAAISSASLWRFSASILSIHKIILQFSLPLHISHLDLYSSSHRTTLPPVFHRLITSQKHCSVDSQSSLLRRVCWVQSMPISSASCFLNPFLFYAVPDARNPDRNIANMFTGPPSLSTPSQAPQYPTSSEHLRSSNACCHSTAYPGSD